ncbi:hypothetical protein [Rhodopirellula bahusiensis]|uniref:hypothetical protein n=1 Tax=Rhodopirellula bahusiensis TaxID=2014065 RepID=UPI003266D572
MSTSLLIDGASGDSIAPMQMHLKTGNAVHSTSLDPPALLAGYMILLSMTDLLESPDIDIGQLKQIANNALPFRLV